MLILYYMADIVLMLEWESCEVYEQFKVLSVENTTPIAFMNYDDGFKGIVCMLEYMKKW